MTDTATPFELLAEKAVNYSKTTIELLQLNVVDKTADAASSLLSYLVIFTVTTLFILILTVGLALWIGEMLEKTYLGFLMMSGFYALIGILIYITRNSSIKYPIHNAIISQMLKKKQHEKE